MPKENSQQKPEQSPIIKIIRMDLGPHRDLSHPAHAHKQKKHPRARYYTPASYVTWTMIALLVGVSIFSFAFDVGSQIAAHFSPKGVQVASGLPDLKSASSTIPGTELLGSNDVDDQVSAELSDATIYTVSAPSNSLRVTAKEYLVGDIENGKIILAKNATTTYPLASVTKLMTALVSKESDNLHEVTSITRQAINTYGTQGNLVFNEKMITGDLIYPMLLESSNDAAEALAEHYGRTEFLARMNQKASAIGMTNTWYDDANGLSFKNVTTATDLFKLTRYIYTVKPEIYDTTRVKEYKILNHTWVNQNHFLALSNFVGGKNGFTDEARQTTASLFTVPLTSVNSATTTQKRTIVVILLQSENREGDVQSILSYVKHNVHFDIAATSTAQ